MNYRGLQRAARQCLRDSGDHPRRLTLLFLLCLYGVLVCTDAVSWVLELRLAGSGGTGFHSVEAAARVDLAVFVMTLLYGAFNLIWSAGYIVFALRLSRRQPVRFRTFAEGFRQVGRVLAVQLLQALLVLLWSLLLVVPGIVAAYRYSMALYIVLDDPEISVLEALAVSSRITYGHKLELLMLHLHFLWYYLPGILATLAAQAYNYGLLADWWYTANGYGAMYLVTLLVPLAMDAVGMAYAQTTWAHAYNWLLSLDRAQREEVRSYRFPNQM